MRIAKDLEPALQGAGFAVSGGSDSVAMLRLLAPVVQAAGGQVAVVTVDHGLRPEAAEEARFVAGICAAHGWSHDTLHWQHDGRGNFSAAARDGRYGLMADWAQARGIKAICLGHTQDDQAETVLMRLARGAGVDGLSGMAPMRVARGVMWLRPLLSVTRAELRAYLQGIGQPWRDDPSNDNPDYERVRWRQALDGLEALGLTRSALAQTATRLRTARGTLADLAAKAEGVRSLHGAVQCDRPAFGALGDETRERLLSAALRWVAGQDYPPRGAALAQGLDVAMGRGRFSLHGCVVMAGRDTITIARESRAVREMRTPTDALWDGRWRLHGPHAPDLELRPLGEAGLCAIYPLPDNILPRSALAVTPAVWQGDRLIAAPCAGFNAAWRAETVTDFVSFLKCD